MDYGVWVRGVCIDRDLDMGVGVNEVMMMMITGVDVRMDMVVDMDEVMTTRMDTRMGIWIGLGLQRCSMLPIFEKQGRMMQNDAKQQTTRRRPMDPMHDAG